MSRSVLHIGPPASSAEPQEFLPADHSIAAFASAALNLQSMFRRQNILIHHLSFKLYEATELFICP